jgi:hypothetical protein
MTFDPTYHPCPVPTCRAGTVGGWNYQFKDGPCSAPDCQWPKDLLTRPHFTETPASPVRDAGKEALEWLKSRSRIRD